MLTRRRSVTAILAGLSAPALSAAYAQSNLQARLLEPGPLPEKIFGNSDAPVTIIEYASITCHHCMRFHTETWPGLKTKYVDTGLVRFIMREFPLDPLAAGGFMLARCAGDEKWYAVVDLLYRTKESWGHAKNPADALFEAVRFAGFTKETFEACLTNEELFKNIKLISEKASQEFGVNSTPTFFINGEKRVGALKLEEFDSIIQPLLPKK